MDEPTAYLFENRPDDGYYAILTDGSERLATVEEINEGRRARGVAPLTVRDVTRIQREMAGFSGGSGQ